MRPTTAITLLLTLACRCASAQFYYKDVLSTQETGAKQQVYKTNHVRKVTVRNYNPDGSENKDFVCEQTLNPSFTSVATLTGSSATGQSLLTSYFDDSTRLIRSVDSSATSATITVYTYTSTGSLLSIRSDSHTTNDTVHYNNKTVEVHTWQYGPSGQPAAMLSIKNGSDTTWVTLKTDDQGNVTDELSYHQGGVLQHYYYYYDDTRHLTDIVRFNTQLQRMVPDYMFEYSPSGSLDQMTIVQVLDNNYLIWRYEYDDNGLRVKELCYDRSKELVGSIGYEYAR